MPSNLPAIVPAQLNRAVGVYILGRISIHAYFAAVRNHGLVDWYSAPQELISRLVAELLAEMKL